MAFPILVKRVYDPADTGDGYRVLVDRLWPRGIRREDLPLDIWAKAVTPSQDLRRALHAGELPFEAFSRRFEEELAINPDAQRTLAELSERLHQGPLTLITSAKAHPNHVDVLARLIRTERKG